MFPSIYTQYPIMTKQKQVFRNLCTFLKTIITEISHLHKYSDPSLKTFLKRLCQRLQPQVFLGTTPQAWQTCPEMFDWVQVRALAGPIKDIQRLVPKSLLRCLGCVHRVVVLLEGEPSPQSEVLNALEQVFIKDLSVLCSVDPDKSLSLCC